MKLISLYTLLLMTLVFSCTQEEIPNNIYDKEVILTVELQMPATLLPVSTRAVTGNENVITSLKVLVFEGNEYKYNKDVTLLGISDDNANSMARNATVTLKRNDVSSTLVFLANLDEKGIEQVNNIEEGAQKAEALKSIVQSCTSGQEVVPMWGEYSMPDGIDMNTINVPMLRAFAVIKLLVPTNSFQLTKLTVYNVNDRGCVVPSSYNAEDKHVTNVTIPTDAELVSFSSAEVISEGSSQYIELYVPETKYSSEMCVIMAGRFDGDSKDTYYKLDFIGSDQDIVKTLLRNYKYIFSLSKVNGVGFLTEEEAIDSDALNGGLIEGDIIITDADLRDCTTNDYYYLQTTSSKLNFYTNKSVKIKVLTNYRGGWSIVDLPEGLEVSRMSGLQDSVATIFFFKNNVKLPKTVYIQAGTIRKGIELN